MTQPGVTQLQDINSIFDTILYTYIEQALEVYKLENSISFLDFETLIFSSFANTFSSAMTIVTESRLSFLIQLISNLPKPFFLLIAFLNLKM